MGVFAFARAALLFVVRWRLQIVPLDVLYEEIVRLDPLLLHAGRGNVDFIAETEEGRSKKAKKKKKTLENTAFQVMSCTEGPKGKNYTNSSLILIPPPVPVTHPRL